MTAKFVMIYKINKEGSKLLTYYPQFYYAV